MAGRDRREAVPRAVRIPGESLIGHGNDHSLQYDYAMIHVCSLARLHETVETCGARHIITLLRNTDQVVRPSVIVEKNHLILSMDDISEPLDGYELPAIHQIETLIDFAKAWDRASPMVVHCYAGISRSTAAAFVSACAINPQR